MNNTKETLYDVLGLTPAATSEEIEAASLRLGEKYRPDKNSSLDSQVQFTKIERAFAILSDPHKRYEYDSTLPDIDITEGNSKQVTTSVPADLIDKLSFGGREALKFVVDASRDRKVKNIVISLFLLGMFYTACTTPHKGGKGRHAGLVAHSEKQTSQAERNLLNAVKALLKDPDSAKFDNSTLYATYRRIEGIPYPEDYTLCGIVNAKNLFGAYTGRQPFIATGFFDRNDVFSSNAKILDPNDDTALDDIHKNCKNKGEWGGDPALLPEKGVMKGTIR